MHPDDDRDSTAADLNAENRSPAIPPPMVGPQHPSRAGGAPSGPSPTRGGIERRFVAGLKRAQRAEQEMLPAWLRPTEGEHRWQMGAAVVAAIGLQLTLPANLAIRPQILMPVLEGVLLIGLFLASPGRISRHSTAVHAAVLLLLALISLDNAVSAGLLVHLIIAGQASNAGALLSHGAAIWATNVIVFGLWYWQFDRGGPVSRTHGHREHADLLFPQMVQPDLASPEWEPRFFDYVYTSFTNATAFSPTDTMPLSRWAKALFLIQSGISLITVALVISRAVNIFK